MVFSDNGIFPVKPVCLIGSERISPKQDMASAISCCAVGNMVCGRGLVGWQHDIDNKEKRRLRLVNTFSVESQRPCRSVCGGKKRIWWQIWVGHFVIFSVQNARGGICRHFLLCGWQGGVCE